MTWFEMSGIQLERQPQVRTQTGSCQRASWPVRAGNRVLLEEGRYQLSVIRAIAGDDDGLCEAGVRSLSAGLVTGCAAAEGRNAARDNRLAAASRRQVPTTAISRSNRNAPT